MTDAPKPPAETPPATEGKQPRRMANEPKLKSLKKGAARDLQAKRAKASKNRAIKGRRAGRGRPKYSRKLADTILSLLMEGKGLRTICARPDIPVTDKAVRLWVIEDHDGFAPRYARARDLGIDAMVEEIPMIADDATGDLVPGEKGVSVDYENINRSRLRVDARKFVASKLAPKRYGDRLDMNLSGGVDLSKLSDDDLNDRITMLLAKMAAAGAAMARGVAKKLGKVAGEPDYGDDE